VDALPARGVPTVVAVADAPYARTVVIDRSTTVVDSATTAPNPAIAAPVLAPAAASAKPILAEAADPELVALFLEEANEEVEKIRRFVPAWDEDPAKEESLVNARRAFHTLKGSGRVVGARDLAEFSWSIENLLNRLLDKTLTRSPVILTALREAVETLPQLVRQLETGAAPQGDIAGIVARAHALAAGRSSAASAEASAQSALLPTAPKSETVSDPTLHDIYTRETNSHVAVVRAWIERANQMPAPHLLQEPIYRACHTLAGSSKMAQARHGIRLAEPLNQWLRKSFDSGVGLAQDEVSLLADCMVAMEGVSRHLDESTGFFIDHRALLGRIIRAEAELDRRIAEQGRDGEVQGGSSDSNNAASAADYDPEIASIFSEEATELLEESQSSFQGIGMDAPRREEFAALKRPLHTLKGGARMAGVAAMGDLAHELESLIIGIELGNVPPSTGAREAVQSSLDELARMRDLLAASKAIAPASALLSRVRSLYGASEPVVAVPAAAVSVVAAPVVVAPLPEPEPSSAEIELPVEQTPVAQMPLVRPERPVAFERLLASAVLPPGREPTVPAERTEMARVDAELLNQLLNHAGEVSIARSRVEQHVGSVEFNLAELSRTVTRLKEQLHKLEIETETQILHRHESEAGPRTDFDPLELDRYSSIQQFSRALAETASDVASIQQLLETLTQETTNLLQQQGRTITELQNGLMRTRMVSFQRHVQRLSRIVRQAASDTDKQAELVVEYRIPR
jgi:chemosensory pili system protein ChpA (sensor histidine kinase/response regulator)